MHDSIHHGKSDNTKVNKQEDEHRVSHSKIHLSKGKIRSQRTIVHIKKNIKRRQFRQPELQKSKFMLSRGLPHASQMAGIMNCW